ncbi:chemotaxis protein [Bifidobacterium goeldii]|uniref:Chemotaxis protein n=1 Tax=Bifidobacterium goeldii TaxID=2306975 RepID=A0A430FF81_9BIFI|nr:chemotaxis protein [Bifidobacterium goeldii]
MRRAPQHVGRKGHQFLSQALLPQRIVLYVIFALLGVVLSIVGIYGVSAAKMAIEANRFISASENLANIALGCGGDGDLSTSAQELVSSTRELRDEFDKPQWTYLRDHTSYGNDITAVRTMLDSMSTLVDGPFVDLMDLGKQVSGFSMQDKTVDLSAVTGMPKIVKQARKDIKTQTARLEKLQRPKVGKIGSLIDTGISSLKSVDTIIDEYDELINLLPQLLGENGERTYLVAIYNPSELRSGGGMVGNVATITANKGKVTIGDFTATTNFEYGTAPYDDQNVKEAAIFGDQVWKYPQTTTVNPNFQRAAVTLKNQWQAQEGNEDTQIAGVFALDPIFMQSLIGATGPITLSDGKVLDGTNTAKFFLKDLYIDHPDYTEQNEYTNKASKQIMTHVFAGVNTSTVSGLLKATRETSASGHFKLWMKHDKELQALVQTKVFDANVAGLLPDDATTPTAGVYFTEAVPSKLDWYLEPKITVTKTCGKTFASAARRLSDDVNARPRATNLLTIPTSQLGDEYTVTVTLKNTLTKEQVKSLPTFVVGEDGSGVMQPRLFLMAPSGGMITSLAYESGDFVANGTVEGHQFINLRLTDGIKPGSSVTIAFTVRAAESATSALNVVTTPVIGENGIYTGTGGQVTDECGTDVPDAVQDQWAGTGSTDGSDTTGNGTGDSTTSAGGSGDQANSTQTPTQEDQNSTDTSAGGLDKLQSLKNNLQCPVDLKKMLA